MPRINIFLCIILANLLLILEAQENTLTFSYRSPGCYEINDKTFHQKWREQLDRRLEQVEVLRFHEIRISQQNYLTLLSHRLPKLKKLLFLNKDIYDIRAQNTFHNILTPKITQKIFTSQYFPQLQQLDLANTLVQFRNFQFMQGLNRTIESNLSTLNLNSNFLEKKAFKLISKINFKGKLRHLGLAQNSLIDAQAVDAVIKMIRPQGQGKSQLKNITVYYTSISADNLIRILDTVNVSNMLSINLGYNTFQHSVSFDVHFNNTLFKQMVKFDFKSLKRLSMTKLDLDNEQLQHLKNWKLPSLQILQLSSNFITDDYFKEWITSRNLPSLSTLSLEQNSLTDAGIQILVNQGFQNLTKLYLSKNRRLTTHHLDHLSRLNSSKLVDLKLSQNSIFQNSLEGFFEDKSFENLQLLEIGQIQDAFHFFNFINWSSMKKLKYLFLQGTDLSGSFDQIFNLNITFPQLKQFKLGGQWITSQNIKKMVESLGHFGPQLELVYFKGSNLDIKTHYLNISAINTSKLTDQINIKSEKISVRKPKNSSKLQIIQIYFGSNLFSTILNYSFFGIYKQSDAYFDKFYADESSLDKVCNKLKETIELRNADSIYLKDPNQMLILRCLLFSQDANKHSKQLNEYINEQKEFNSSVYLPYLRFISYIPTSKPEEQPQNLFLLNKIDMPILSGLIIQGQETQNLPLLTNRLLKRLNVLKNVFIQGCKLTCQSFQRIFWNVTLSYLKAVGFAENQIQKQCYSDFVQRHRNLKKLDISGNFIQTGLFDQIISKNQLILQSLVCSDIQIGNEQFSKLSKVNRQFIILFVVNTASIDSTGIKMLIGNTTGKLFPRCQTISLQSNNINQQGLSALLQTGIPFLRAIFLSQVNNPNLLNILLSYPNQLAQILIPNINIYGIDQNLDPRSTRHLQYLYIQASTLQLSDYKALARLDFQNLIASYLFVSNIYDCQVLKYILEISQNTKQLILMVKNQKIKGKVLTDQCIPRHDPKQVYMRHLSRFGIMWTGQNAYIPNFYSYLYSDSQLITRLALSKSLIGDEIFLEILNECNLEHLIVADLDYNLLTDLSISQFFKKPLNQVKQINIASNQFTSQSLVHLVNKTFPLVKNINLSQNDLQDRGIEYLVKSNFPVLESLVLNNIGMKRQSLLNLHQLKSPKLKILLIVNNNFNEHDLAQFVENIPVQKFTYLELIITNTRINSENYKRLTSTLKIRFKRPLGLEADIYHLDLINKAQI